MKKSFCLSIFSFSFLFAYNVATYGDTVAAEDMDCRQSPTDLTTFSALKDYYNVGNPTILDNEDPKVLDATDTLMNAVKKVGYKLDFYPPSIRTKGDALTTKLCIAYRASGGGPQSFEGISIFAGRIYPPSFYRKEVYPNNSSQIINFKPAHEIGKTMPYIEGVIALVNGTRQIDWVAHQTGGAQSILNELVNSGKPITLYRGTTRFEAAFFTYLKRLTVRPAAPMTAKDTAEFDALIRDAKKHDRPLPAGLVSKWTSSIKPRALRQTAESVANQIVEAWNTEHNTVFTTENIKVAQYFESNNDKKADARVLQFVFVDPKIFENGSTKGIYGGIEGSDPAYLEIGFSSAEARKALLNAYVGTVSK